MTVQLPWDNYESRERLRGWEDKPLPSLPIKVRRTTDMHVVSMDLKGDEMMSGGLAEPKRTWSIELGLGSPRMPTTPKSPVVWV